jgi:hypothetical protein
MNPAEIVISEIESEGGAVVRPFLTKAIGQSGESSSFHPNAQVVAFDSRGSYSAFVGVAKDRLFFGTNALRWRVSRLRFGRVLIDLNQLGEIDSLCTQAVDYSILICFEPVGCDLKTSIRGVSEFFSEGDCIAHRAMP